jgi:DNA-binding transcriptional regulator GbsR (MarR family)
MPSPEARLRKLEKRAKAVETRIKKLQVLAKNGKTNVGKLQKDLKKDLKSVKGEIEDIIMWIKAEAKWSKEVTKMLRLIDWAALANAYPGAGGTNPPQTPPDWPVS